MKLSITWLEMESISWSIWGKEKQSLGHALFKSMRSTHILHFSLVFFTNTTFASHVGNFSSFTNPASRSLFTSSSMAACLSVAWWLIFFLTRLAEGLICKSCVITSRLILGMSDDNHAKTSLFALKSTISCSVSTRTSSYLFLFNGLWVVIECYVFGFFN